MQQKKAKRSVQFTFSDDAPQQTGETSTIQRNIKTLRNAEKLSKLGGVENTDKAAELFEELAHSKSATPSEIYMLAQKVNNLDTRAVNKKYAETTARILELMIDPSKNPTPTDLIKAADMFNPLLGSTYHEKAVDLYLTAAASESATPRELLLTASKLTKFGNKYHHIIAGVLERISEPNLMATPGELINAGNMFNNILGTKYFHNASEAYLKATFSEQATPEDIYKAAVGLYHLGSNYAGATARILDLTIDPSKNPSPINYGKYPLT